MDLKWDKMWYDVNRHTDVGDVCDPVGGVQEEGVIDFVGLRLHILDVPPVDVLLCKRLDRRLLGSDITFFRFHKPPEKAMRGGCLDCEYDLRRQVVLMSDL